MKIAMTGGGGRVGKYLAREGVIPLVCDVTDPLQIVDTLSSEKPNVVIHLAAKSDVDFCEDSSNEQTVINTNLRGTFNVLDAAERLGVQVVMLSSDHVFSGKWHVFRNGGYLETDKPNPINYYGFSKFAAEGLQKSFDDFRVVRTSYLFDKERLDAISSMTSQPTFILRSFMYMPHFISNFMQYLHNITKMPKLLHISGDVSVSWYKFMAEYLHNMDIPFHNKDKVNSVPRPHYAGLRTKYKLLPSYSYRDGFRDML